MCQPSVSSQSGRDKAWGRPSCSTPLLEPIVMECRSIWETESESNVGFYRNLGFAVIEEIEVVAATVPIWLMSRPAAT